MGNRAIIVGLVTLILILAFSSKQQCDHSWTDDPFWVSASGSFEEPTYYPPSSLAKIQHCQKCGIIRLTEKHWSERGSFLSFGRITLDTTLVVFNIPDSLSSSKEYRLWRDSITGLITLDTMWGKKKGQKNNVP